MTRKSGVPAGSAAPPTRGRREWVGALPAGERGLFPERASPAPRSGRQERKKAGSGVRILSGPGNIESDSEGYFSGELKAGPFLQHVFLGAYKDGYHDLEGCARCPADGQALRVVLLKKVP